MYRCCCGSFGSKTLRLREDKMKYLMLTLVLYFTPCVFPYQILVLPPGIVIPADTSVCDLTNDSIVIVPCRPAYQLPLIVPPVAVDCSSLNNDSKNIQRCINVV